MQLQFLRYQSFAMTISWKGPLRSSPDIVLVQSQSVWSWIDGFHMFSWNLIKLWQDTHIYTYIIYTYIIYHNIYRHAYQRSTNCCHASGSPCSAADGRLVGEALRPRSELQRESCEDEASTVEPAMIYVYMLKKCHIYIYRQSFFFALSLSLSLCAWVCIILVSGIVLKTTCSALFRLQFICLVRTLSPARCAA